MMFFLIVTSISDIYSIGLAIVAGGRSNCDYAGNLIINCLLWRPMLLIMLLRLLLMLAHASSMHPQRTVHKKTGLLALVN